MSELGTSADAFEKAHDVLQWLESVKNDGYKIPYVELFADGSAEFYVPEGCTTNKNLEKLSELIHSNRWGKKDGYITLAVCQGLRIKD